MNKPGDKIKVITKDKEYIGLLMPAQSKDSLIIKLDSGYNIGIDKKDIKKIQLIEKYSGKKAIKEKIKEKKGLPTITILHTGGTIASKVDYKTGAVVAKFTPEDIISLVPELKDIANIRSIFVSNLQSESMRFGHYNLMAKAIEKELKQKPKGIIITHGTDTLHYSAAALSFMLENILIPVILIGAQRSSDRGSSDAAMNLICAARFISKTDFKGVAICMHENMDDKTCAILPGTKSRKMHTSRRDAFKPINSHAIARVCYKEDNIEYVDKNYNRLVNKNLKITYLNDKIKIGILKTHTNIHPEDFTYFKNFKGLIIEGTGLGHTPTTGFDKISKINENNKKALANIIKNGVIVVLTSQCIFGRVNMNVYSPQRELLDIGIIPGEDMTTETAFIKLSWLLSNYKKDEVKELISKNLRGEINKRIMPDEFLE